MARKRANSTKNKNVAIVQQKPQSRPLQQPEAAYFQNLVDCSNRYAALLKQKAKYEFILKKLEENRKKIQTGEVKLPVTITLIPQTMYYQEYDKKEVFKFFDEHIESYKNSVKSIEGQLEHRYEEYTEAAIRNKEFLNKRYNNLKAQQISMARSEIKDEENIFEAEFEEMMKNPKLMEEFKEKKKEAIKVNIERAKKQTKSD